MIGKLPKYWSTRTKNSRFIKSHMAMAIYLYLGLGQLSHAERYEKFVGKTT